MDQKTLDLFKEGKYLRALKNYAEVAAVEDASQQQALLNNNQHSQHKAQANNQMHRKPNTGKQVEKHGKQGLLASHKSSAASIKSLQPRRRPITKESIIKVERNSSVATLLTAIVLLVVLLVVFFYTL